MAVDTGISQGSQGYVGVMLEYDPIAPSGTKGTFVPATADNFLAVDAPPTLSSKFDKATNEVYLNSPDTNRSQLVTKAKVGGTLTYPLYIDMGMPLWVAGIGQDAYLAAVTADTYTAATSTTVNGLTTMVLVTGTGAYLPGAFVKIDTGAVLEYRQIISWNSGTKTMTVAALAKTHTGTPAIQQLGQHKISPIVSTGGKGNLRRYVSIEENIGDEFSWQYPSGLVDKLGLKAAKDKIQANADIMFDAQRVPVGPGQTNTTPTALSTTSQTDTNLAHPYTYDTGFLVLGNDASASGTSVVGQALNIEDWSFSLDNKVIQKAMHDNTNIYRCFPGGQREVKFDYSIVQQANRSAAWLDYLQGNVEAVIQASIYQTVGSTFYGFGLHIPNAHFDDAEDIRALNDVIGEKVMTTARQNGATDVCQIFAVTSLTGSAY